MGAGLRGEPQNSTLISDTTPVAPFTDHGPIRHYRGRPFDQGNRMVMSAPLSWAKKRREPLILGAGPWMSDTGRLARAFRSAASP